MQEMQKIHMEHVRETEEAEHGDSEWNEKPGKGTGKGGSKEKKEEELRETQIMDLHLISDQGTNELPHRLPPAHHPLTLLCPSRSEWGDVRGQGAQTHRKRSVNSEQGSCARPSPVRVFSDQSLRGDCSLGDQKFRNEPRIFTFTTTSH